MSVKVQVSQLGPDGEWRHDLDLAVPEEPVALVYNGISHVVMMATPADLEDFALGFSLSEGLIQRPEQIYDLVIEPAETGQQVQLEIDGQSFQQLKNRRRQLSGRSGCGLCGVDSLDQATRPVRSVTPQEIQPDSLTRALSQLRAKQPLNQQTGAAHAAAWCDPDGHIQHIREDVGRHNALDKLIGACQGDFGEGFALISSRASYEMVHKACSVGIGALAAVSAPTSLAIDQAELAGLTLLGFARPGRYQRYQTHASGTSI